MAEQSCTKEDIEFIPLAIEKFGRCDMLAIDAINTMSRRIADLNGLDRNDTSTNLPTVISDTTYKCFKGWIGSMTQLK